MRKAIVTGTLSLIGRLTTLVVISIAVTTSVHAQDTAELAKAAQNPVADMIRAVILAGVDLRDRRHGRSTSRPWIGGARGWLPRWKVSMMIIGPPQLGHG